MQHYNKKKFAFFNILLFSILQSCLFSAFAKLNPPPSPAGLWTTIDDKTGKKRAVVRISLNEDLLTGTIIKTYKEPGDQGICVNCPDDFKNQPIEGLQIMWDLFLKQPGVWEGGYILDPKAGKIYRVKVTFQDNKLYVRGFVGFAALGRTQTWQRYKPEDDKAQEENNDTNVETDKDLKRIKESV